LRASLQESAEGEGHRGLILLGILSFRCGAFLRRRIRLRDEAWVALGGPSLVAFKVIPWLKHRFDSIAVVVVGCARCCR